MYDKQKTDSWVIFLQNQPIYLQPGGQFLRRKMTPVIIQLGSLFFFNWKPGEHYTLKVSKSFFENRQFHLFLFHQLAPYGKTQLKLYIEIVFY